MFESFYMAGFECATGVNAHGEWIDQIAATGHDVRVDEDYARLVAARVRTLREAVRWPLVDRGGSLDFTSLEPFLGAARRHGVQVIWDLFHYGYPLDLDPFGSEFAARFARYCAAVARHIGSALPGPHFFTPINEASYFAWAAGEVGRFAPHTLGRGHELKIALARAALAAVRAIREVCPGARIVTVDPICHVVPPHGATSCVEAGARHFSHHVVFQFLDMMAGYLMPELGGSRDCLDIVGVNYYWTNQWEVGREQEPLEAGDPRRVSVAELVRRAARRYGGPVVITETAGVGRSRAPWIDQISGAAIELLAEGTPLAGVCLYPILGMPEWHDRQRWTNMGLWDVERPSLARTAHLPALRALVRAQRALGKARGPRPIIAAGSAP